MKENLKKEMENDVSLKSKSNFKWTILILTSFSLVIIYIIKSDWGLLLL